MLHSLATQALVALAGIGIATGPVDLDAPPEDPTCEEAREWVDEHADDLPTSLDAVSELPTLYRRAVFAEMSVPERRKIWREHLGTFLGPDSDLTEEQKETVRRVRSSLNELVTAPPPRERVDRLAAEVAEQFGLELGGRVFAMLGPVGEEAASTTASASAGCGCCTGCTFTCTTITGPDESCGGADCGGSSFGCGFLFLSGCDGQCG